MICAWDALLGILPLWLREDVDKIGSEIMQELRLRMHAPPELVLDRKSIFLKRIIGPEDISFTVNAASRYSPWTAASMAKGFLTAPGGHRIGLCGETVCKEGSVTGIREVTSLNIRVARDFSGIGVPVLSAKGSVLILGPPGWGKTTLLRDMIRQLSGYFCVSVIDERGELFPGGISRGKRMDVLTGAGKNQGIDMVLRTMGPQWIAVDEITAAQDCDAIVNAHGCGVRFIATAHSGSMEDFCSRPVYRELVKNRVFETVYIMCPDKSFRRESVTW